MTTTSGGRPPGAAPPPPRAGMSQGTVVAPAGTPLVGRQRRARVTVNRIDPWTVLRLSFLLSIAAAIITVVAVIVLWAMLTSAGVFSSVDGVLVDVLGADSALTITQYFTFGRVASIAVLIGAIDVVLITALSTIGAFLFNVAASLTGGLELSVTEDS
jgi:hypothetical protein